MKPNYDFKQRPTGEIVGDTTPIKDSSAPRDGGEGMSKSLAGTPKSALDLNRGFVRSDIGGAAKSDKPDYR